MKSVIITLIVQSAPPKHQSFVWNAFLCSTFHFQISSPIKGLVTCIFQFESVIYITYGKTTMFLLALPRTMAFTDFSYEISDHNPNCTISPTKASKFRMECIPL